MKFCTKCGTQNQDENLVCTQCNSSLVRSDTSKMMDKKLKEILINAFGVANGMASIVLGIITFSKPAIAKELEYLFLDEMGSEGTMVLQLLSTPATIFSFAMGSLLVMFGIFVVLYFCGKLIQRNQ